MDERKNLFLICKEAIHNIIKYADCTEVIIGIKTNADKIRIMITDNGKGFNSNGSNPYNGNGLSNMKTRAEEISGNCQVTSQPGSGTSVEIIV